MNIRPLLPAIALLFASAAGAADFGIVAPAGTPSTALAEAAATVQSHGEKDEVFTGRVGRVCQKQGCWMMLVDGDVTARVMTGHRFFLPKDASGDATVYGKLIERELDEKTARHFARESGGYAVPAQKEYRIDAIGVSIAP